MKNEQHIAQDGLDTPTEDLDPMHIADHRFEAATGYLTGFKRGLVDYLKSPRRTIGVCFPVQMDDESVKTFHGYRVLHNRALGPGKGGVRYHPDVTREEVIALATAMTWKCALAGIPFGGAKGAVICDPKALSEGELRRITRRFISELGDDIGPHIDIPAPDLYTNESTMAWVFDTYDAMHPGQNNRPVVTGKPLELGGSLGRPQATARGCVNAIERVLENGIVASLARLEGARVCIQGFGEVGREAALLLRERGARIVALSDSAGGVCNEDGLDIEQVIEHKEADTTVVGTPGTRTITNEDLLTLPCDILVPAALSAQIRQDNAGRIDTKLIAEAANLPSTPAADDILGSKGTVIIPDILANAGGVIVSYFEWVQNMANQSWSLDYVNQELAQKMHRAVDTVIERHQGLTNATLQSQSSESPAPPRLDLRTTALVIALERVARVTLQRGIWP